MKIHGLGFILDLELDEIQMEYLLITSWKVVGGIDFSSEWCPDDCLQNATPVFLFPETSCANLRMERCYEGQLHSKESLRTTNRGGVVKLTVQDLIDHTTYLDEPEEIPETEESEEESNPQRSDER